ncbi:SDR family NAD(P)-dependent oxidoreductase [Paenarthrobacter sp. NPDC018779]|uniref:SDR family NAD(P)-dependent oxidoreductase n=1 Tax=Paenarthrobacter sp. NPDC018779 TaxID=3364375 RepID=UPI0037C57D15
MQLNGKAAIVTGGGQGIGCGITRRFLEEGASVAVIQRRPLEEPLASHPKVHLIQADLTDMAAIPTAVELAVGHLGAIDVLVNNAGIMFERGVEDIQPGEWELMMALNLRAPRFLIQAALPHLRRSSSASIINIGSIEGLAANPGHSAYSASKAGIHGMTKALAVDLGADAIRCSAIAPGWIASEFSEKYLDAQTDPDAARAGLQALHPAGRIGQPGDVGDLAVFLASDRAGFMTGEVLVLDGGRMAKLPLPF